MARLKRKTRLTDFSGILTKEEGLKEGELVKIDVEKIKRDAFGVFKGMSLFTREDEWDTHG